MNNVYEGHISLKVLRRRETYRREGHMSPLSTFLFLLSLSTAALADEEGAEFEVSPPIENFEGVTIDRMRAPLLDLSSPLTDLNSVDDTSAEYSNQVRLESLNSAHPEGDCSVARHGCVGSATVTVPLGKRSDSTSSAGVGVDHVLTLQEMARREHHRREMDAVLDQLQLAWAYGEPLTSGVSPAATPSDRRRAILNYWAALPDTAQGREEREVVREFLKHVVQPSPWPVTQQELDVAHATCGCEHPLDL